MEKIIAAGLTAIAALLFSLGYLYLNAYYATMGVSMFEVDYTINDILVHSIVSLYWGIKSKTVLLSILALVVVLLVQSKFQDLLVAAQPSNIGRDLSKVKQKTISVLLVAVGVLAIVGLVDASVNAGSRRAIVDIDASRPLWVGTDENFSSVLSPLNSDEAYLTYISATKRYVFAAIRYRDGKDYWVVRLDRAKINHMRIYRDE